MKTVSHVFREDEWGESKNDHHRVGIKQHWEGEAGKRDSDEGTKKKTIREPVSSILDFSQSSFLRFLFMFFFYF